MTHRERLQRKLERREEWAATRRARSARHFEVAHRIAIVWPEPTHGPGLLPVRTAAECIDWSLPCPSIFERRRPLAEKTLWRIAQGIRRFVLESPAPFIVRTDHHQSHATNAFDAGAPLGTITPRAGHAVVAPHLVKVNHGGRDARVEALTTLVKFNGNEANGHPGCAPLDAPLPTVMAQGNHVAEVRAFLTAFTARHRLGLVAVEGVDYQIVDIGMRMLEPHEMLRAQFGRFAATYDLSAARTKTGKVRLIGNSVCPEVAEALVRANLAAETQESVA